MANPIICAMAFGMVLASCSEPGQRSIAANSPIKPPLPALPTRTMSGQEARTVARQELSHVADQVVEVRHEVGNPDYPVELLAMFGQPRSSSIPGLCETRVVELYATDWRTAERVPNVNLGGRAAVTETRYWFLYPHWWGPPGAPDYAALDRGIREDDARCVRQGHVDQYFHADSAVIAIGAASDLWNAVRYAASRAPLPFKIVCSRKVAACADARRTLASMTTGDIVAANNCTDKPSGWTAPCYVVDVNRVDSCGDNWTIEIEARDAGVFMADENRPTRVVLDPDPCED